MMQEFEWRHEYSGIFMVWCIGYLERPALVPFLKKAKAMLDHGASRVSRHSQPKSFIFVFDNILYEGEESKVLKGQRVRTVKELESIFAEAGLIIHECSGLQEMPAPF